MTDTPSDLRMSVLPHYSDADLGDSDFAADAFAVFLQHGELFIADPVPSRGYMLDAGTWGAPTDAVGPTLTELPAGQWVFYFGALASAQEDGETAQMQLELNGELIDDEPLLFADDEPARCDGRAVAKVLIEDTNTVTVKYSVSDGVGWYAARWLYGVRYPGLFADANRGGD